LFGESAHHVKDDARLPGGVEVEAVTHRDVEQIVVREPAVVG